MNIVYLGLQRMKGRWKWIRIVSNGRVHETTNTLSVHIINPKGELTRQPLLHHDVAVIFGIRPF